MNIRVNGEPHDTSCLTLAELVTGLGHNQKQVATAVNKVFVPLDQRDRIKLSNDDSIEVIAPMSGG